ncbi:hypothetical protein BDR26DRAFT_822383 [Obelidium mucronatum]|nr:hypothetical protein BDR26DRAFT_822383 [Obelidium mucronatum]
MKRWIRCASTALAVVFIASLALFAAIANTPLESSQGIHPATDSDRQQQPHKIHQQTTAPIKHFKAENIAFALKTGSETAASRAAIQLLTFLKHAKNVLVVAESGGFRVGDNVLEDVYTGVYDAAEERLRTNTDDGSILRVLSKRGLVPDQVIPGQKSRTRGWTLDAHKNLPAFQLLKKRFPDAEWYVMFDDDSFVYLDNLQEFLSTLDPDKPHYLGQANRFKGCDGVTVIGQGPKFAQGGAGIVISRGAMNAMSPILDKCILKYRTCWAGDIRVGLCMRDAGILAKDTQGFYGIPPNANFYFPNDPCVKPFIFHHALPHQIQSLYDIQISKQAQANNTQSSPHVTMADVFHYTHFIDPRSTRSTLPELRMQNNTDIRGRAVKYKEVGTPKECLEICEYIKECVGWTWDGKVCWTKNGAGKMETKEGMWGGVLAERYRCSK